MAYSFSKFKKYVTIQGDSFDSIALDFYDDETKAGIIMQANPECIGVIVFDAGVALRVPVLEDESAPTLPPWR